MYGIANPGAAFIRAGAFLWARGVLYSEKRTAAAATAVLFFNGIMPP